ncbi:TetR/AcrR family transcriptional regulator [Nocardiopsis rhodophaea]|uniref:TetR/AcrR family transcriptional regulator n=1 Tax=Nocardiopsis rhodophaea TaxID=280238 RepID=UPI0031D6393A
MSGEVAEKTDGRRARGERRRSEIIGATLRVVERDGVAGVTHRAVAREAEVPASSALYYFATLDDLLVAALTEAADSYVHRLRELVEAGEDPLDGLAGMVTDCADAAGRARSLAEYELTLLAVRRPVLRPIARKWIDLMTEVAAAYTDDPVAIRAAVAVADGLCMEALLEERPLDFGQVRAVLRYVLRLD